MIVIINIFISMKINNGVWEERDKYLLNSCRFCFQKLNPKKYFSIDKWDLYYALLFTRFTMQ